MFLHLGADVVVSLRKVTAILDLRTAQASEATRAFVQACQQERVVLDISGGQPKSLVLTDQEVFLSSISSLTLKKRADALPGSLQEEV